MTYMLPKPKTDFLKKSISYQAAVLWNSLDNSTRAMENFADCKKTGGCQSRELLLHKRRFYYCCPVFSPGRKRRWRQDRGSARQTKKQDQKLPAV